MIKAIIFDLVGVLVFKKEGFIPISIEQENAQNIENLFNHIDDEKLLKDIKEKLKLTNKEIEKATSVIHQKFVKFEKLWETLPSLKKNYKLAVINNGNAIALNYWRKKFNFDIFNLFINSAEVKIKKPDKEIFILTCNKLKVKPTQCLFLDDTLENIESAGKLGMKTILFNKSDGVKELIKLLKKNLIK
ncbi:HAD-IA family hydrolase [Patescibacteria group bacterium]|nr:HAD-IA family hydrolase [Patescibacteria group bacterium]